MFATIDCIIKYVTDFSNVNKKYAYNFILNLPNICFHPRFKIYRIELSNAPLQAFSVRIGADLNLFTVFCFHTAVFLKTTVIFLHTKRFARNSGVNVLFMISDFLDFNSADVITIHGQCQNQQQMHDLQPESSAFLDMRSITS